MEKNDFYKLLDGIIECSEKVAKLGRLLRDFVPQFMKLIPERPIDGMAVEVKCILSIGNPQNCHQNSLFLEREFLVLVRTRFLHSEVLSGASMHAASDNFSRRT